MTYHIIEPCCCERQLPSVLKNSKGATLFTTNGDVTTSHLFKSVSSLAGVSHTMTLCIREADIKLLRAINTWMKRGWTVGLTLCTATDQGELVGKELKDFADRVTYAADADLTTGVLIFEPTPQAVAANTSPLTTPRTVIILGTMLSQKQPGLHLYSATATNDRDTIEAATKPLLARIKTRTVSIEEKPDEESSAEEAADTEGEEKSERN